MGVKIDFDKEIWEGWTVRDFILELEPMLTMIQSGNSWLQPIKSKEVMKKWCMENQPSYKRYIPEVVQYFCIQYNIQN